MKQNHVVTLTLVSRQRNAALDEMARLQGSLAYSEEARLRAYELLAQCIKSGQVEQEDIPGLLDADPDFKEWYENTTKNQDGI